MVLPPNLPPNFITRINKKTRRSRVEGYRYSAVNSEIVQILEDALFGKHSPDDPLGDKLRHAIDKAIDDVLRDY